MGCRCRVVLLTRRHPSVRPVPAPAIPRAACPAVGEYKAQQPDGRVPAGVRAGPRALDHMVARPHHLCAPGYIVWSLVAKPAYISLRGRFSSLRIFFPCGDHCVRRAFVPAVTDAGTPSRFPASDPPSDGRVGSCREPDATRPACWALVTWVGGEFPAHHHCGGRAFPMPVLRAESTIFRTKLRL